MVEDGKFRFKKFNDKNYQLWKMQMEDYLYQNYIFLPLGRKTNSSSSTKDKKWEVLERKALGSI
jgi:hypothetical protein